MDIDRRLIAVRRQLLDLLEEVLQGSRRVRRLTADPLPRPNPEMDVLAASLRPATPRDRFRPLDDDRVEDLADRRVRVGMAPREVERIDYDGVLLPMRERLGMKGALNSCVGYGCLGIALLFVFVAVAMLLGK